MFRAIKLSNCICIFTCFQVSRSKSKRLDLEKFFNRTLFKQTHASMFSYSNWNTKNDEKTEACAKRCSFFPFSIHFNASSYHIQSEAERKDKKLHRYVLLTIMLQVSIMNRPVEHSYVPLAYSLCWYVPLAHSLCFPVPISKLTSSERYENTQKKRNGRCSSFTCTFEWFQVFIT